MRWYEYKMEVDDLTAPDDLKAKLLAMTDTLTAEEKAEPMMAAPAPQTAAPLNTEAKKKNPIHFPVKQLGTLADELKQAGCTLRLGPDYLEGLHEDVIFRTPGLRPDVPQLAAAVANGSMLTSEMEEFFRVCPCPIIAVTGSDGKTTTTTIIAELLKAAGNTVWVGGNIGHPLLCDADRMRPQDYAVLELSSFQLMTMDRSPHIAVVTNLAPNHLDMHKDMAEYVAAKENIFRHQTAGDIAVFNADNAITAEQAGRTVGRSRRFSRQTELNDGVFLRGEDIVCRSAAGERGVMKTSDIKIPGVHNVENYMAAIAAVDGLVPDGIIRDFARSFCLLYTSDAADE